MSRPAVAKLVAPRPNLVVRRARVHQALDRALRAGVCWVAAPAGYGKTTAVADYLRKKALPHVWYRVDEGDQDIASFFYYMAGSLRPVRAARALPVFGPEYADQPEEFARRFFRAFYPSLRRGELVVLDDLHYADTPSFRAVLAIMLRELPHSLRCVCLSRTLPPPELADAASNGQLQVVDQSVLQFSEREARALIGTRLRRAAKSIDVAKARGWAAGLVLLAEHGNGGALQFDALRSNRASGGEEKVFAALARRLFDTLPPAEQEMLLKLSLLPEITFDLACGLADSEAARPLLDRLLQRQLLITRGESASATFRLHDLMREFLRHRVAQRLSGPELFHLYERAATFLGEAGYADDAIDLALQGKAWPLAHRLIAARADTVLTQGRRVTLTEWCARLPDAELDAELCYWLGVANMADDAAAERWFSRAWSGFVEQGDLRGQQLTAAQAVLSKTDSWRTHEGLSTWTQRVLELLDRGPSGVDGAEQLLISAGTVRALDFADHYSSDSPAAKRLTLQLLERLGSPRAEDPPTLRLLASESLIEHASATGNAELFEKAVDNVAAHLRDRDTSPWALGMWLVAFGAATGRHFSYARRGFPYPSPEAALRAAIAIGEREALRGVEFGALYHLQYSMKLRNDFAEFEALIDRLAEIADSRYTTQVAVVADCRAALHTVQENFGAAYRDCERFMAAIEAANEPPIERWPHFVTKFQVLLADRKPREAAALLEPLLSLFAGGVRRRTQACVSVASALDAKWNDAKLYSGILRDCMSDIRAASWNAILLNLPELLAELCGDAIELDIEPELCRSLIDRRRLTPPRDPRTARWPWPLKVHVLGDFKLERDGAPLDLGTRPPTRSLDIVRALAIAKDHTCSLEDLYEWLWPEADGAQAKSACEQALHRLRKLLGSADLIVQREGKLRLAPDGVWVDLADWEARIRRAFAPAAEPSIADSLLERAFHDFRGPLLRSERTAAWAMPAIERVHGRFIDLVVRLGKRLEARHELSAARTVYLRALDHYPTSERCYEALLRLRLAEDDRGAALEDYRRYERILASTLAAKPSRTIRALIAPLLAGASAAE